MKRTASVRSATGPVLSLHVPRSRAAFRAVARAAELPPRLPVRLGRRLLSGALARSWRRMVARSPREKSPEYQITA